MLPGISDPPYSASIHPEVRIANSRCGPDMDLPFGVISEELNVIDKSKNSTSEFDVQVHVCF
jgi:hypothetical protein